MEKEKSIFKWWYSFLYSVASFYLFINYNDILNSATSSATFKRRTFNLVIFTICQNETLCYLFRAVSLIAGILFFIKGCNDIKKRKK